MRERPFNWSAFWYGFRIGMWPYFWPSIVVALVLIWLTGLLSGCTHVHPIDVSAKRVDEVPQRVHALDHECERCGDVATENVSEVADEDNWRCNACKPRDMLTDYLASCGPDYEQAMIDAKDNPERVED